MDVGEFSGLRLYTGLRLDYRIRLCAPTSTSHAISAVAELVSVFRPPNELKALKLAAVICFSFLFVFFVDSCTHRSPNGTQTKLCHTLGKSQFSKCTSKI